MNEQIKIIDNFLEKSDLQKILTTIESPFFPWYYYPFVDEHTKEELEDKRKFQFVHTFYASIGNNINMSDTYEIIKPIVNKLNPSTLIRIKTNLLTKQSELMQNNFHTDFQHKKDYENMKTAIFYVNTNNGKTIFENGQTVDSVANRVVIFPANLKHTGTTCTDKKTRVVINFNYYVW